MNTTETFDLVDIGLNLVHKQFQSDRYAVLERARKAGVRRAILTGVSVRASEAAAALAAQHAGRLWSTAGVHPHEAKSCDNHTLPTLRRLAALPQVRAIGECGLDYNRDFSPREVQRQWFEAQVELAAELGMPLFVHERDALDDTVAVLEPHFAKVPGAVIHCFTGNEESLDRYLELGMHIGITGWICDERRGLHLR
ncbi:MAG: TatD family hydrolase, partial [Planctomycetota bacterium]